MGFLLAMSACTCFSSVIGKTHFLSLELRELAAVTILPTFAVLVFFLLKYILP